MQSPARTRLLFLAAVTLLVVGLAAGFMYKQWDAAFSFHPRQTGVLWRIDSDQGVPSYLFGTIHSDDERILRLPDSVLRQFQQARSFTGEVLMDEKSMISFAEYMFFRDGTTLESVIGAEMYAQVVSIFSEKGLDQRVLQFAKPWTVVLTLSVPVKGSGEFLDQLLFRTAHLADKAVFGLETAGEQAKYFDELPLDVQTTMLRDTLQNYDAFPRFYEELVHAYLQRDLNALERLSARQMQQGDPRVAELFNERFIVERNHLMLKRMQSRLEEGGAFIAVGALHLPGEHGLLRLLENSGYRVTSVY